MIITSVSTPVDTDVMRPNETVNTAAPVRVEVYASEQTVEILRHEPDDP
jgi:hypothetical protein